MEARRRLILRHNRQNHKLLSLLPTRHNLPDSRAVEVRIAAAYIENAWISVKCGLPASPLGAYALLREMELVTRRCPVSSLLT